MAVKLKPIITSVDDLPEEVRPLVDSLYDKADDGKLALKYEVEGMEDTRALRNALERQKEEAKKVKETLKALEIDGKLPDPKRIKELEETVERQKDQKLILDGKFEEAVETRTKERTEKMKSEYEKQVTTLTSTNQTLAERLDSILIDKELAIECAKASVRKTAVDDVISRARRVFRVINGHAVPLDSEGKPIYGKDPTRPMTMGEWLAELAPAAPHLFEESRGSGASQGGGSTVLSKKKRSEMTAKEKAEFISQHGQSKYLELPA